MRRRSGRTHVFFQAFDQVALEFGPSSEGNLRVSKILGRDVRTIHDWRIGAKACPRWAFELLRLTAKERKEELQHMTGFYAASRRQFLAAGTRLSSSVGLHWGASANDETAVFVFDSSLQSNRPEG